MKKKLLITGLACVLLLISSFGLTYSYLKAYDNAKNTFIVGETKVEIDEPSYTPPEELTPGLTDKDPRVKNTALIDCYVRMRVDFSNSNAEKFCTLVGLEDSLKNGDWVQNDDGYYYYKDALEYGTETSPLFESVSISKDVDPKIEFNISLYAEAREAIEAQNYKDAWGL